MYIYGDVFSDIKNPNLIEIKGDIRNQDIIINAARGADAIIHLACISNDPSFELDPAVGKSINYDAFYNVLEAAKANKVKRLIYASTSSVYGIKSEKDVIETASLEPLTDYSKYKAECERALADFNGGFEWAIIRPATVCGYARRLRLDLVVNIMTINALVNRKIKIFGGEQLRPNINILDMVRVYELFLSASSEKIDGQTFNAGFQNLSLIEIAKLVKKVCNQDTPIEIVPTNDKRSYHINSDKIKKVMGFKTKFTVEDGIRSLIGAFNKGLIKDGLSNPLYHNIKRMQEVQLK